MTVNTTFTFIHLMPRATYSTVHELAAEQFGIFTTVQARELGVDPRALAMMCRRGTLERESHGVYRDLLVQPTRLTPYMAAALWPLDVLGVLSHETALDLSGLSDVNPAKIHITIPKHFRVRREVPALYVLHHANLRPEQVTSEEGLPVTTAAQAIRDCYRAHLGPAFIRQAIADSRRTGRLHSQEAEALEHEMLPAEAAVAADEVSPRR